MSFERRDSVRASSVRCRAAVAVARRMTATMIAAFVGVGGLTNAGAAAGDDGIPSQEEALAPSTGQPAKAGTTDEELAGSTAQEPEWSAGVSNEQREAARKLVREGNQLLRQWLFGEAADKYRQALAHWDHPAIHYNLALILFDQPVEAHFHLEEALRYGEAALDPEKRSNAKIQLSRLEQQLSRVDIRCKLSGTVVKLDNRVVFIAPGRHEGLLRPGLHVVEASRAGFAPKSVTWVLQGGDTTTLDLNLASKWKTWDVVAGVGASTLVAGGIIVGIALDRVASSTENHANCPDHRCTPRDYDKIQSAYEERSWSAAAFATAGVSAAAGLGYLLTRLIIMERSDVGSARVFPEITERTTGLSLRGTF